jgi:hypothetical protein
MPQLNLEDNEAEALVDLLESKLRDLSYEISDTDTRAFKDQLKARRDTLKRIQEDLKNQIS